MPVSVLRTSPKGTEFAVVEGNFFTDPLPDGHDVMIVANTLHVLSVDSNLALLDKMHRHAAAGTRLLLVDWWMDPTLNTADRRRIDLR